MSSSNSHTSMVSWHSAKSLHQVICYFYWGCVKAIVGDRMTATANSRNEYRAKHYNSQNNKPVGFYNPIAPPVPNAPSSRIFGQNPRNDADATFLDLHISVIDCRCTPPILPLHATIGGRLPEWQTSKCVSSVSFVRIASKFFQNTQDRGGCRISD